MPSILSSFRQGFCKMLFYLVYLHPCLFCFINCVNRCRYVAGRAGQGRANQCTVFHSWELKICPKKVSGTTFVHAFSLSLLRKCKCWNPCNVLRSFFLIGSRDAIYFCSCCSRLAGRAFSWRLKQNLMTAKCEYCNFILGDTCKS